MIRQEGQVRTWWGPRLLPLGDSWGTLLGGRVLGADCASALGVGPRAFVSGDMSLILIVANLNVANLNLKKS